MFQKPCAKCGKKIGFRKLPSGKYLPVDLDDTPHYKTCGLDRSQSSKVSSEYSAYRVGHMVRQITR